MSKLLVLIAIAAVSWSACWATPNGAPTSACSSMTPGHYGGTEVEDLGYLITPLKTEYYPGEKIKVTLHGGNGEQFKGFLVQMRKEENDGQTLGSWSTTVGKTTCSHASGVTHTDSDEKTSVDMEWNAPSTDVGNVQIWATVVKEYTTWSTIKSSVIYVAAATTATTTASITTTTSGYSLTSLTTAPASATPAVSSVPASVTTKSQIRTVAADSPSNGGTSLLSATLFGIHGSICGFQISIVLFCLLGILINQVIVQ